uniref:DDE_Tnp_IS1595 domain-containing protein n=1 Tax=Parastrongyloides trichosuri TaxID=131310 RepID=A0A0N4ZAA3_PARTI
MKKYFSFLCLLNDLDTDYKTLEFAMDHGLIYSTQNCPNCCCLMKLTQRESINTAIWRCYRREFNKSISIRAGSFLENNKTSMKQFILYLYLWSNDSSSENIAKELKLCENTISTFNFKIRSILQEFRTPTNPIGGVNDIIEIDETVITKRKYNKGRLISTQWIVGSISRRTKKFFIVSVPNRNESTLIDIIKNHVLPNSTIYTDGWRGYRNLTLHGYSHKIVIHQENFVNPKDTSIHTQNIENLWSILKRFLRKKGTNRKEIMSYINEFAFKNNCGIDSFNILLEILSINK